MLEVCESLQISKVETDHGVMGAEKVDVEPAGRQTGGRFIGRTAGCTDTTFSTCGSEIIFC